MGEAMHLLRGTVDALILKAVAAGPLHGYGIADFVQETTGGVLEIEDGALYRALHRLEDRGWLSAEWGVSAQGRRAKFYCLTEAGRERLAAEQRDWERYAEAVGRVFASRPGRP
jgi:PadR family transcriptional regulator, regulatory protein PadR